MVALIVEVEVGGETRFVVVCLICGEGPPESLPSREACKAWLAAHAPKHGEDLLAPS